MGILRDMFGKKATPSNLYVEYGFKLVHKLATKLKLSGFDGQIAYSMKEQEALDKSRLKVRDDDSDVKFHPQAGELVAGIYRSYAATALKDLADENWLFTDQDVLPSNWKEKLATYLKSFAADLSPLAMNEVAVLLVVAGYKTEAKEAYNVILQYPDYARLTQGKYEPLEVVEEAREQLSVL
jgi:hypothetical protein